MSWKKEKLANIASYKTGKLDSNAAIEGGKYPFFTCSQQPSKINIAAFDTEAVILGGNNANGIFPLHFYSGEFNAYQRTYVIESLSKETLDNYFLYYSLRLALQYFKNVSIGATTQYLTKSILDNFDVSLPPINVQQKIASILAAYDDLIENNRRRIQLLEESARQLYKEWFVRLHFPGHEHVKVMDGVPEGWEKKTLGEVAPFHYGKALTAESRHGGDVIVYASSGQVGTHDKALVKAPGIVIGRKGNVGSVYWINKDYYPIDTTYYISPEKADLFFYYAISNMNFISTDVAVPGLNRDYAHSRNILVPEKIILSNFLEFVTVVHNQIDILNTQNRKLAQARDLLLPKLMSSEVAV